MADKKISQLTGATTPLAGTEVLPIVQGGSTVKVSAANITAGRTVSAGSLSLTNGGVTASVASGNIGFGATTGTTNYSLYINDADGSYRLYSSFGSDRFVIDNTGNFEINVGNLKLGTAGKGIDFSANTHAPGMTSELLTWYEEGTWTPADGSGAALSFGNTANNCFYTRVGRMVICIFGLSYPVTANASAAALTGLPFISKSSASNVAGGYTTYTDAGFQIQLLVGNNDTSVTLWKNTGGSVSNAELSGKWLRGVITYFV